MKYYVSYITNRKNAKRHRYNHQFSTPLKGSNKFEAYNSIVEARLDIETEYCGVYTSEMARKVKNWYIHDTKGNLVLMGSVYKNSKGGYEIEWTW